MNNMKFRSRLLPLMIAVCATTLLPLNSGAEDIDIFVSSVNNTGTQGAPNVLIILDNSSNWARSQENWPPNTTTGAANDQAHAEVESIIRSIAGLTNVNIGLMLINQATQSSVDQGAFVNFAVKFIEPTAVSGNNKFVLNQRLNAIDSIKNLNSSTWSTASTISYGGVMFDAFKYFGGYTSPANIATGAPSSQTNDAFHFGPIAYQGGTTPVGQCDGCPSGTPMLDPAAYTLPNPITTSTTASNYNSAPLTFNPPGSTLDETCGSNNFIIFVTNKRPNADASTNLLTNVGGSLTPRVPLPAVIPTVVGTGNNAVTYYTADPNGGEIQPTGTPMVNWYMPEWARFLRKTDVSSLPAVQNVTTYVINVYHATADQPFAQMLMATAKAGGGKYYTATNNVELDKAFGSAFVEIQAKSSTFASASLPISATNRAQNANEVYIGMFRPDQAAQPRWFGNMKRYQLIRTGSGIRLGDALGVDAVNNNTGFITECAASYWSSDSGTYWTNVNETPAPIGLCTIPVTDSTTGTSVHDPYSDFPDGPLVEKGAVAEVLRKRNTTTTPRVIKTSAAGYSTGLTDFITTNTALTTAGLTVPDIKFTRGEDINDENADTSITDTRASVHGDVVHSRPLPVNYGASTGGTVIYYGSNDGLFRAVDADTGTERWAYVAPEFYPPGASVQPLARLRTQSPIISYPLVTDPTAIPKNYFFDGSIGRYQSSSNDKVWIYPTMRRGGRMVYAFDVSGTGTGTTPPALPTIKWKFGCDNSGGCIGNGAAATAAAANIGQSWSIPAAARVNTSGTAGTSFTRVVIMGGGYDTCEDANQTNPTCTNPKGNRVFILDADNGSLLAQFTTVGRVPSDVALIDVDYDGIVDYAYVGDTVGNLYRISFGPSKTAPLGQASWTIDPIAGTTGGGRKFLYPPAVVSYHDVATNKTYVYTALGSGDREKPLESQYPYASDVKNRFYMFLDDLSLTSTSAPPLAPTNLDGSSMVDLSTDSFTISSDCSQGVVPGTVNTTFANKKGWFIQYSNGTGNAGNQGEQTVTSAVIVGGQVAFSTNRPIHATGSSCSPAGEAKGYFVNLYNASGTIGPPNNLSCGGDRSDVFVGGGLPPSPVLGTVTISSVLPDGTISSVPATVILGAADKGGGPSTVIGGQEGFFLPPQKRTRSYWKQDIDD